MSEIAGICILKVAWEIASPSIKELLESSLPEEIEKEILEIIKNISGVRGIHNLKTRKTGVIFAIEAHVEVDKELTVESSHQIATQIENSLKSKLGNQSHIGIHIEPFSFVVIKKSIYLCSQINEQNEY